MRVFPDLREKGIRIGTRGPYRATMTVDSLRPVDAVGHFFYAELPARQIVVRHGRIMPHPFWGQGSFRNTGPALRPLASICAGLPCHAV